jgi:putative DNA primase/helicase
MSDVDDILDGDDDLGGDLPPPSEPMAVARQLVRARCLHNHRLILRRWRGGWWQWITTSWREIDESKVRGRCYAYTEHATWLNTTKKLPKEEPWAPTRHKILDLMDVLGAVTRLDELVHPPEWIIEGDPVPAAADQIISVRNGLLHVHGRTLHPHTPALFNLVSVPFAYEPDAVAPRWQAFLDTLWPGDPDSIAALQEFFGLVISGRTDLHKILLLVGPTRAGKGVIARILKSLVGVGNAAGPTLASLGTNFGLQPLIGKPLAIIADARLGDSKNVHQVVERLLSISGEDMLTVDVKFKEPWTGTLPTRFVIISNELPRFGDASGAIARRFIVLSLTESWIDRENTHLTDELLTELPGILNWAIDGMDRLACTGRFTEPVSSRDAIIALQDLVSPVAAFVRDRCVRGPDQEVPCQDLYAAWRSWAEDQGQRPGTAQTFGRNLRACAPNVRVGRPWDNGQDRVRTYQGVGLVSPSSHNGPDRGLRGLDTGPTTPQSTQSRGLAIVAPVENDPRTSAAGGLGATPTREPGEDDVDPELPF